MTAPAVDLAAFPRMWARNLWHRYRMRPADWLTLWNYQGGCCFVCRRPEEMCEKDREGYSSALVVEHDHSTGTVRSLACGACNGVVGGVERLPAELRPIVATPELLAYLAAPPARLLGVGQHRRHP